MSDLEILWKISLEIQNSKTKKKLLLFQLPALAKSWLIFNIFLN
jgi:hypothetical protein